MPELNYSETVIGVMAAALKGISGGPDYFYKVRSVTRYDRRTPVGDLPAIRLSRERETWSQDGDSWGASIVVRVEGFVPPDENISTDLAVSRFETDIKTALTTVRFAGHEAQLVGIDSDPFPEVDPNEPQDGVIVDVTWTFRLNYADPTISTGELV